MLGDNIITVLLNFWFYLMLHKDFRQDLIDLGVKTVDAFFTDLASPELPYPPYYDQEIPDQIILQGYTCDTHTITTGDGYLLTAFRIPGPLGEPVVKGAKQPVYMQHGLLDDAGTWVFNSAELDLSLELVDRGYDVWLTNSRGSVYSNKHISYDTKDNEFWDFTFHEMGTIDVPSNLHYITQYTGFDQVVYVGHSQGTTQWFIANALDKEIHQYFKAFVGIAPATYEGHQGSALLKALDLLQIPDLLYYYFDHFLYMPVISTKLAPVIHFLPRTVWTVVEGLVGFDDVYHIDLAQLPQMARNDVGGTSTKNLMHWFQNIRSGDFKHFDYGKDENQDRYGSKTPPSYDMSHFKETLADVPMLLFIGDGDYFVMDDDFSKLQKDLPDGVEIVYISDYNHLDVLWAADTNDYVNYKAIEFIEAL